MEKALKKELYDALTLLERDAGSKTQRQGRCMIIRAEEKNSLIESAVKTMNFLRLKPHTTAVQTTQRTGVAKNALPLIYKLIQRCDAAQRYLVAPDNKDYFNVVNDYFNHRLFTIVFFVGLSCPIRCAYCPNVRVDETGKRILIGYAEHKKSRLKKTHIERIFQDLNTLKAGGTNILVKISGGLEPLTDMETVSRIAKLSRHYGFHSKILTNGILLNAKERRLAVLETNDIRISLSTADADQYENLCFGRRESNKRPYALQMLKSSIRALIRERNNRNPGCRIGFNSVITESNCDQISSIIEMGCRLGVDYIDFKPDYFSPYDVRLASRIEQHISDAKSMLVKKGATNIYINFAGSLSRSHLFWQIKDGICDAIKQSDYKMFITPFGHCCPIHCGAFPHSGRSADGEPIDYFIGKINHRHGLLRVLAKPTKHPKVPINKLNPFELMLSLEITREEEDLRWGIPLTCSPYHTSMRELFPSNIGIGYLNERKPESSCHTNPR